MIKPNQQAEIMDWLEEQYWVNDHDDDPTINCQSLTNKTMALVKADRMLMNAESGNKRKEHAKRRVSLLMKIITLYSKDKSNETVKKLYRKRDNPAFIRIIHSTSDCI